MNQISSIIGLDSRQIKAELKKEGRFSEKIFLLEQRNRIDNNKREMFNAIKGAQFSGSSNPAYVMAVNDLRRITRDKRVLAMSRLSAIKAARGEPPVNLGNTSDVRMLLRIAKGLAKER